MTNYDPWNLQVPWFESPFFEQMASQSTLPAPDLDLARRFHEDGVAVFDPGLPDSLLDAVTAAVRRQHGELVDRRVSRVQDAWVKTREIKDLATWPAVLEALRALYQRDPIPFQTLNFEWGTQQRAHSDSIHFQTHPANWMAGVWVALEDVDEQSGPLFYLPGSHLWPSYGPDELDLAADFGSAYAEYEDFIEALIEAKGGTRKTLLVRRGQAVIWAANVLHGGSRILDPNRTRRSQVTHYYFAGAAYYTPMTSEVFLGRVHYRTDEARDIRTGMLIPHTYKGHPFQPAAYHHEPVSPARHGGDPAAVGRPSTLHRASMAIGHLARSLRRQLRTTK